jgi:hypothetical protein
MPALGEFYLLAAWLCHMVASRWGAMSRLYEREAAAAAAG